MSRRRRRRSLPPTAPEFHELDLTALLPNGNATATLDGLPVEVAYGLPGERVEVEIWERGSERLRGGVVRVLRAAPERIEPPCPYFGRCGGCQWQHLPYAQQLHYKRERVRACLAEVGLADLPLSETLPAPDTYGYRNHGRFSIGRLHGELGFTSAYQHRFLRIDACPIMHPRINEILAATQRQAQGHQLAVRVGTQTGELLINPAQSPELPYASGQSSYEEAVAGRRYRISAAAFFQVNTAQAERLIATVGAALALTSDDLLLDLYCGVGTFGLALAAQVRRVIGVEESAAALHDARHNARDLTNVEFLVGRAEEVLLDLDEPVSAAIVDPPRVGCRPAALEALVRLAPRRLAYVSCDPSTLARDLRVLSDGGFRVITVQPVDMFPQTAHVEAVALLHYGNS